MQPHHSTHLTLALTVIVCALCLSCESSPTVTEADKLCQGRPGFGARITGAGPAVDMCVPEEETSTTLGRFSVSRYDILARFQADSLTFEIELSFLMNANLPAALNVTGNRAEAFLDPNGVWFAYRETKTGDYAYESTVAAGFFSLTFADTGVVVASFSDVRVDLTDSQGNAAGSRVIQEGFLSAIPEVVPRAATPVMRLYR